MAKFCVEMWGSKPGENDDCWMGFDFETEEEARAKYAEPVEDASVAYIALSRILGTDEQGRTLVDQIDERKNPDHRRSARGVPMTSRQFCDTVFALGTRIDDSEYRPRRDGMIQLPDHLWREINAVQDWYFDKPAEERTDEEALYMKMFVEGLRQLGYTRFHWEMEFYEGTKAFMHNGRWRMQLTSVGYV